MSNASDLAREAGDYFRRADAEGRPLTSSERTTVQTLLKQAEVARGAELRDQLYSGHGAPSVTAGMGAYGQGPGDVFVQSEGFKRVQDPQARGQNWTTGAIDVGLYGKGTIGETPGLGGDAWVSTPQVIGGAVPKLFQPLTIENLFLGGQATTSSVRYVLEGTATSGAAGVLEGGTKPESTLGFTTVTENVKKVATSIVTSDELLDDVPAIQAFVNSRLAMFVNLEVERQPIRGTAGGAEVQGLLTSRSVPVYGGGTAAGNKAEQIFKAMNGVRGSAYVEPDWIVIHPTDYEQIRLLKDSNNQLYGGGPFFGPYGGPQGPAGANGQVSGATDAIWSKPVYVTAAVGAGTAIIGTRAAATVWSRGGLTVEATNSHASLFVTDQVAIRAERRLAFGVMRPAAFCEVRLA